MQQKLKATGESAADANTRVESTLHRRFVELHRKKIACFTAVRRARKLRWMGVKGLPVRDPRKSRKHRTGESCGCTQPCTAVKPTDPANSSRDDFFVCNCGKSRAPYAGNALVGCAQEKHSERADFSQVEQQQRTHRYTKTRPFFSTLTGQDNTS